MVAPLDGIFTSSPRNVRDEIDAHTRWGTDGAPLASRPRCHRLERHLIPMKTMKSSPTAADALIVRG